MVRKEADMTREERENLIARYVGGYDEVVRSLADFPPAALTARPLPGKWSAAEIVHHLGDAEPISAQRLRTLLVQDHPLILAYDQEAYARLLRYAERPIEPALEAFRAARANTAGLLRGMPETEWTKPGWHTEAGPFTAETWLTYYSGHAHRHAGQIRRLREALEGPR
jgi:hypothetical protein